MLDKAIAMVRGKASLVHHESLDQPAISFGNRSFHQIAGVWRMTASPLEFQLTLIGEEPPSGSFRPELSPEDSEEWLTADPDAIKLTGKGLIVEKGITGNFLSRQERLRQVLDEHHARCLREHRSISGPACAPGTGRLARDRLASHLHGRKGSSRVGVGRLPQPRGAARSSASRRARPSRSVSRSMTSEPIMSSSAASRHRPPPMAPRLSQRHPVRWACSSSRARF